ncbi:MAG: metallophosphoesterase family protein [Chloroflexi bacterium]|nr:metallophosphoesterase family protein [Chloroflexota bacterium]
MTRIAVLSDIHGNLPALEAAAADMQQFDVDQVVVNGDVINWGPFNREVMEFVLERRWTIVRGNNEYYMLDYDTPRQPVSWRAYSMPSWLHEQVRPFEHIIAGWPDTVQLRYRDAPPIRVFHGYPGNPWDAVHPFTPAETVREKFAAVTEDFVITAHSHLWLDDDFDRWHIFNPGTVGAPLDGIHGATYMVLDGQADGWKATFRRVDYDIAPVIAEFERQDFVARIGNGGKLIMKEFVTGTLWMYPFKIWQRQQYPDVFVRDIDITDALIAEFMECDVEQYMPPQYRRSNWRPMPVG